MMCNLLQVTAREPEILHDASQRRCWLVPKQSLLVHMSHPDILGRAGTLAERVPCANGQTHALHIANRCARALG
jgi:hypothetical protein